MPWVLNFFHRLNLNIWLILRFPRLAAAIQIACVTRALKKSYRIVSIALLQLMSHSVLWLVDSSKVRIFFFINILHPFPLLCIIHLFLFLEFQSTCENNAYGLPSLTLNVAGTTTITTSITSTTIASTTGELTMSSGWKKLFNIVHDYGHDSSYGFVWIWKVIRLYHL